MRIWDLSLGSPLSLTLSADFRLGDVDYFNDTIWELDLGGGDPPAFSVHTTYGLRARSMRLFLRFSNGRKTVLNPNDYAEPLRVRGFYPNFLSLTCSPFDDVQVSIECWVPDSHTIASRLNLVNRGADTKNIQVELCGILIPIEGQSLSQQEMQMVHVLTGQAADLMPVVFMTGGPKPGPGPYPSLLLDSHLTPGNSRQFTWVQAALRDLQASFDKARRTAALPWDAQRAQIELLNASQTIQVTTGDPEWDAAIAFSQKSAYSLFFPASELMQNPSFVRSRLPEHGYQGRGSPLEDHSPWGGQSVYESYYLSGLLRGSPELIEGLLRNYLAIQQENGYIDCRPGLAGQRGRWLAPPMLASIAWEAYQSRGDESFLTEVFPQLLAFYKLWFTHTYDRDGDGFPEWDHPSQTGFEDDPAFSIWHPWGQGMDISQIETPALAAMLFREGQILLKIADLLGLTGEAEFLKRRSNELVDLVEDCWDLEAALYHKRDRDEHFSSSSQIIGRQRGVGVKELEISLGNNHLVHIQLHFIDPKIQPEIILHGRLGRKKQTETLTRQDFRWTTEFAAAVSRERYSSLTKIEVSGVRSRDRVILRTLDHTAEDHTLFLPIWAKLPDEKRARAMVQRSLLSADRFYHPFGISACTSSPSAAADTICLAVHLPWNQLIGEGLLAYGMKDEAALLTVRLMSAVIQNLKRSRHFYNRYHAESGAGIGERGSVSGLAPLGLFMKVLGVQIRSPECVRLTWLNPFPWPVTVQYRGLTVSCRDEETVVTFSDGQTISVNSDFPCVINKSN